MICKIKGVDLCVKRKIIHASLVVMLFIFLSSACSFAEVVGTLVRSGASAGNVEVAVPEIYSSLVLAELSDEGLKAEKSMRFYDSLTLLQLALNRGEIDAMISPELVGEYMLRANPDYRLRGFLMLKSFTALAFGFMEDRKELCGKFSRVIEDLEREGVIGILARDFITGPLAANPPAVELPRFDGAEKINVAVTGDMPPLDYVASDGKPAGFNVALMAEIAKKLRININPVYIETAARPSALKSGRADAVFWFMIFTGYDSQPDLPEGVITSTPYYGWNKVFLIGKK